MRSTRYSLLFCLDHRGYHASEQYHAFTGYSDEVSPLVAIHPEDVIPFMGKVDEILQTGVGSISFVRVRSRSGEYSDFQMVLRPVYYCNKLSNVSIHLSHAEEERPSVNEHLAKVYHLRAPLICEFKFA